MSLLLHIFTISWNSFSTFFLEHIVARRKKAFAARERTYATQIEFETKAALDSAKINVEQQKNMLQAAMSYVENVKNSLMEHVGEAEVSIFFLLLFFYYFFFITFFFT